MNTIKLVLLLSSLAGVLMIVGYFVAGKIGVAVAFILSLLLNFGSYWYSDRIVLKMYGAQEVSAESSPVLYDTVRDLARRANLPMPRVYIMEQETPNAFATGRNPEHAAVAVTTGIMKILDRNELSGVIAHELSHIQNRDTLIGTVAATMAGAVVMVATVARWGAVFGLGEDGGGRTVGLIATAVIAPVAATLIQMAISRSREYLADASGARMSGRPKALASALAKLSRGAQLKPLDANPATAHLFIVNPLSGNRVMNLFSTHPPIEKRIERLMKMKL
ncbi:MAG TPA: zinc metalloprotease HtpX [Syntrophales bacterium]|jgi:heat shock protein HtpX|nr:zinc metalloprotease HtpX [Syntrophales bacterium]